MKNQTQKRAFYVLTGCIVALALCIAAALALLCRTPAAQDVSIPGTRGTIYATVQLPGKLAAAGICRWPCFATALRAAARVTATLPRWRRSWPRRASPRCGWISPAAATAPSRSPPIRFPT